LPPLTQDKVTEIMNSTRFDDDIWLLNRITHGSEYELHLAFWPQENQRVLIKSLKPIPDQARKKKVEARLLKEASTLEEFWSPYFPKVYDIRRNEDDTLYLILQYFEGVSLRQYLDLNLENGLKLKAVEKINSEISHALSYLHSKKKVIHFDLSPENIIISPENKVHLIDFEDTKIIGKKINQKNIRGKANYMAPELKEASQPIVASPYFDNYARNIIFKEMLGLCSGFDRIKAAVLKSSKPIPFFNLKARPNINFSYGSIFNATTLTILGTLGVFFLFAFEPFLTEPKNEVKKKVAKSTSAVVTAKAKEKNKIKRPRPTAKTQPKAAARRPAIPTRRQVVRRKSSALRKTKAIQKPSFRAQFQRVVSLQDEKLKKCLKPMNRKEVLLGFVLEKNTGKLIRLKTGNDISNNQKASACIAKLYRDLNYPLHPSRKEVEITQRFVLVSKP